MAKKNGKKRGFLKNPLASLPRETNRAVFAILLFVVGAFLLFAAFGAGGAAGNEAYQVLASFFGVGYFLLPVLAFVLGANALKTEEEANALPPLKIIGGALFFVSGLGFLQLISGRGGTLGAILAEPLLTQLDIYVSLIALGGLTLISLLILVEGRITLEPFDAVGRGFVALFNKLTGRKLANTAEPVLSGLNIKGDEQDEEDEEDADEKEEAAESEPRIASPVPVAAISAGPASGSFTTLKSLLGSYTPPPLSLLERDKGRPGVGDIKGNANIIKRTLQNFGIQVELDEISIGPSVTRYAVKPAEGVRLQKIVALQKNLELALSASSIRIEAPIPGKSLVGIEVPNSTKVTVGLGALLDAAEYKESGKPLTVALGRDIAGTPRFANIAKMPHLLIAGATGSGKSVAIHGLINSLLYRCGPAQLRFIMIDPKRVELTLYRSLPHLLTPVITDAKKAIMALRWAGKEMERRYNLLEEHRVRDIESYHSNILAPKLEALRKQGGAEEGEEVPEAMPYIVIILDELADIMQTYPRELEAAIVRLAQMSRAVGIHLVLSTQRPSVNVITGLIKANVPARVALQVASQIDSRTIIDQGGAESLLGAGDMLFLSADMSKPVRLQNAFISETEVKKIADYIAGNNDAELPIDIGGGEGSSGSSGGSGGLDDDGGEEDDMYEAARQAVIESGKASTSFLQRRLGLGYARAARIMDSLEARGVIGPANGAKPRDILQGREPAAAEPAEGEQ